MCHHVFQMLLFPVVTLIPFMWFLFVHLIMVYGPYNYFDFISQISNNGWNDRSKKIFEKIIVYWEHNKVSRLLLEKYRVEMTKQWDK